MWDKIYLSKYTLSFNKHDFYHMHTEFQHVFSKTHSLTDEPKSPTGLIFTCLIHTADIRELDDWNYISPFPAADTGDSDTELPRMLLWIDYRDLKGFISMIRDWGKIWIILNEYILPLSLIPTSLLWWTYGFVSELN